MKVNVKKNVFVDTKIFQYVGWITLPIKMNVNLIVLELE